MNTHVKSPFSLRTTPSRPDSPVSAAPLSADVTAPRARPLGRLQNPFRRNSSLPPTPTLTPSPGPKEFAGGETYVDKFSLKVSEAVSKALSNPTPTNVVVSSNGAGPTGNTAVSSVDSALFKGKKPIPQGRGTTLGALIKSELELASNDPNLHRAILRVLHRPLSVLLTNLSAHILPLLPYISHPHTPPSPPVLPGVAAAAQTHAIALSNFSLELLQTFYDLGLGVGPGLDRDGLRGVREALESLVRRVVGGLLDGIKEDLGVLFDVFETPLRSGTPPVPATTVATTSTFVVPHKPSTPPPPDPITYFTSSVPSISQKLARYTSGCPAARDSQCVQALLAGFLIKVMWKAAVALSMRPLSTSTTSPPVTALPPSQYMITKPKRSVELLTHTPPATPPSLRFSLLPTLSRPPSPPLRFGARRTLASEIGVVMGAIGEMVRPKEGTLARDAVDEAWSVCADFEEWVKRVEENKHSFLLSSQGEESEVPLLLMLNVLLGSSDRPKKVSKMLGVEESAYREGWLSGFGRAEECESVVGKAVLVVLEREGEEEEVRVWLRHRIA